MFNKNSIYVLCVCIICITCLSGSALAEPTGKGDQEFNALYKAALDSLGKENDQEALDMFLKALDLKPDIQNAPFFNHLGFAYMQAGDVEEAIVRFKTALRIDPKYADAYSNLGSAYASQETGTDLAVEQYQKAIELDPKQGKAYLGLGWVYLIRKHHPQESIKQFTKAIEIDSTMDLALYGLGLSYVASGKSELSIKPISTLRAHNKFEYAAAIEASIKQVETKSQPASMTSQPPQPGTEPGPA
ncbi:MAG: hypothetical protein A3G33_02870 [Omnitrophica bacterium RIFCSPLOWO2_12_FULL_44_17]|uniref:Uncharacterized protein n=1 Tax=Candidatus Danuiimicrobium aquiferis TaxID=1801832 RepID=A0A1G1KVK1_9BACT|nr:MAG: hypothetical protein A3B72_04350 [Omnitrophica bacterium RIFCSPHIGHO2_02_FULL_45_28]OGW90870.1 MAG: hypothetical protein A3E74_01575 [Omnitrophica bacterium RIFCSPHIGHO2_12_FULL_44_12]OGW96921.1 MAG: hypothetical protein A3G33_02870 [Omnitrophica bacterium RIFCSPLOWO2_12_FULL_44_17]OGX03943.1 MAG: hypothetical protein A3J12_03545 [Omnitrophica bacterium RIFCSPLOWO2_02_FULL_44_11]